MSENIEYTVERGRAKQTIRLRIKRNGLISISAPKSVSDERIKQFVRSRIDWIVATQKRLQALPPPAFSLPCRTKANFDKHKLEAKALILERLKHFNACYGFAYNNVFIKDQTSRWGSCSKAGNLNFSYRVALLPQELMDYVVVHELCHLKQFNHSQNFWDLVAEQVPNYKVLRAQLRVGSVM